MYIIELLCVCVCACECVCLPERLQLISRDAFDARAREFAGPQWWPFIGNTRQLRRAARQLNGQHLVFEQWMADYASPVIGLKLGSEFVVVAMTYPMVREVHTNPVYDGRPDNFFLRLRTMGTR